jgi:hypothetical protein
VEDHRLAVRDRARRHGLQTLAYNLRTGKPIGQVEGNLATVGDGWVATVGYNDGKTTITVYRL